MANPFLSLAGISGNSANTANGASAPSADQGADLAPVVDRIAAIEGTGQNARSSARGIGQFTDDTLLGTYRRHYPNSGLPDKDILALKDDPQAMHSMLGHLVRDNASALSSQGHDASPANIYLANYFGAGGAHAILSADPATPIGQIVGEDVLRANPNLTGLSAGDVINMTGNKMGQPATDPGPNDLTPSRTDNKFLVLANGSAVTGSSDAALPQVENQPHPGMLRRAGEWLTEADPLSNAIANGGDDKLGTYTTGVQDRAASLLHGATAIPDTLMRGGAWALDNIARPVTSALGANTRGLDQAAKWARGGAGWLDEKTKALADNPDSPAFTSGDLAANVLTTLPLSEARALEAIPYLGSKVAARNTAALAGNVLPRGERAIAAATRYGDMALQGAAAGGLTSRGDDVGANMAGGAVLSPVAGAAVETLAPIIAKGASKAAQLARGLREAGGEAPQLASHTPETGGQAFRAAGAAASDYLPAIKAPPGVARFAEDGSPLVAMNEFQGKLVPGYGTPHQPGARGAVKPPQLVEPKAVTQALGSNGAKAGLEATTDLPSPVTDHVRKLVDQGVPLDQALREADITHIGGRPTIAAVTRDPAHQQAFNEGAKMVQTPEGRALNLQQTENNGVVHSSMRGHVENYGGVPAQGEAAQTAAMSLAKASDAQYGRVRDGEAAPEGSVTDLYAKADAEAAALKGKSDAATASSQRSADIAHAIQVQFDAREELDAAQAVYRIARQTPGAKGVADVDKARTRVEDARTKFRQVSDSPPKAALVEAQAAPGYISTAKLSEALDSPELANPTVEGAKSLRSGVQGLIKAYGGKTGMVNLRQAEKIRQAINDAYDPLGSGINTHVGTLKGVLDQTLDETQAGPAYRAARAAYKDWAGKYDNPHGVASLIKRDAQGNFKNADDWHAAERRLISGSSDKAFAQVVRQLKSNGDDAAIGRLKATILQRAYAAASRGAQDAGGNAPANGAAYFKELSEAIGMNKLQAVFSPEELAEIATTGRAALHLNSPVPGTNNASNTASATLSHDMARRMMEGIHGAGGGSHSGGKLIAGSSVASGVATIAGHTVLGPAAAIAVPAAKFASDAIKSSAAKKALANALRDAGDPIAARAAAKLRASKLAEGMRRQIAARGAAKPVRSVVATVNAGPAISQAISDKVSRANDRVN